MRLLSWFKSLIVLSFLGRVMRKAVVFLNKVFSRRRGASTQRMEKDKQPAPSTTDRKQGESFVESPDGLLERQTVAVERLADFLAPKGEKRFRRLGKVLSSFGGRLLLGFAVIIGSWELLQWLYATWEIRQTAEDYAVVASELFYRENNPEVAKGLIDKALELTPDNSNYRFIQAYIEGMGMVRTLLNLDRPYTKEELDRTHQALGKAIFLERQAPDKPEAHILRGQIYAALRDYDRAKASLKEAIGKSLIVDTRELGLVERVIDSFQTIMNRNYQTLEGSDISFAYVRLAFVEHASGSKDKAKAHLAKALEYNSTSKWAYLWLGIFESKEKNWVIARQHYDKALELDPRFDLAIYNKAWTYMRAKKRDYNEARILLQQALALNPEYKEAYYALGMVYGYQNKYQVAHGYLSKAVEIDPMFPTGWKWRAIVSDEMGHYSEALAEFSRAIALIPASGDLYVRRARVYKKQKDYGTALQDLLLAKDLDPGNYRVPYYTAEIYAELKQYENAIDEYTVAVGLRTKYSEAHLGRAEAKEAIGDLRGARTDYDLAVSNARSQPERSLLKRGQYFYRHKGYDLALADFQNARNANGRFHEAWLGEAKTAWKLGNSSEAKLALNEYLKLQPQSAEGLQLKILLKKSMDN